MLPGFAQFFERRGAPTPPLPYDAEVEYLESTGTQYVNTNVVLDGNMIVEVAFQTSDFGEDGVITYNKRNLFPFCASAGLSDYGIQYFYGNKLALLVRKSATTSEVPYVVQADTAWHVGVVNTASMTVALDGTELYDNTQDFYAGSNQRQMTLCPFSARGGDYKGKGRISFFTVTNATTGATIIDLIPVRFTNEQGVSEGAMYDRLGVGGMNPDGSPRTDGLYRNRGTGAFLWAEKQ